MIQAGVVAIMVLVVAVTTTVLLRTGAFGPAEARDNVAPPWQLDGADRPGTEPTPSGPEGYLIVGPTLAPTPTRTPSASPSQRTPSPPAGKVVAVGRLNAGKLLLGGQSMRSTNGGSTLLLETGGNLVLRRGTTAVWSTRTGGHPGAFLAMQGDGNLVVYSAAKVALWNAGTAGNPGAYLALGDSGELTVRSAAGRQLWTRVTEPGVLRANQLLIAGQRLTSANGRFRLTMGADGNATLSGRGRTPITTGTAGNPGAQLIMQGDGNLVIYSPAKVALWNARTAGNPGAYLRIRDDGSAVIYSAAHRPLWTTTLR